MSMTSGMSGKIGQISRTVSDIKESERWYIETLEFTHLYTFETLAFFDCLGTRLCLSQSEALNQNESLLYFSVDDMFIQHKALVEKGVDFIQPPHMIHKHDDGMEEWMAFFKDLEGRPLALMSRVG